jgi:hypothetical protein
MASKKAALGGSLWTGRHKDIRGVLSTWREVVKDGVAPEPKLSTLCYAHAAPRQPVQLPDYTLMYAHIGRLAILHISIRTFICT